MAYAADTKVPIQQTRSGIEALLGKWKAQSIATLVEGERAIIAFRLEARNIRFTLPLIALDDKPGREADKAAQENRARWRRLLLVIKAKFESIESGVETLDEAFLAHVQMPSGMTVMEEMREGNVLALRYQGKSVPLLPAPQSEQREAELRGER